MELLFLLIKKVINSTVYSLVQQMIKEARMRIDGRAFVSRLASCLSLKEFGSASLEYGASSAFVSGPGSDSSTPDQGVSTVYLCSETKNFNHVGNVYNCKRFHSCHFP